MKVIDCRWEIDNIGKRTVEITIDKDDAVSHAFLQEIYSQYEYVVVKVPMMKTEYNHLLASLGFVLMECQMNVSMEVSKFDYSKVDEISSVLDYKDEAMSLESVLSSMSSEMFSTDRITLDREFGPAIGMRRYQNWMRTEVERGSSLYSVIYQGQKVGFMLFKISDGVFRLLLNGLYKEWQGRHLGIITPSSPLIYAKRFDASIYKVTTSISSNNIPAVKLYNRLGFTLDSQTYVFSKHRG